MAGCRLQLRVVHHIDNGDDGGAPGVLERTVFVGQEACHVVGSNGLSIFCPADRLDAREAVRHGLGKRFAERLRRHYRNDRSGFHRD